MASKWDDASPNREVIVCAFLFFVVVLFYRVCHYCIWLSVKIQFNRLTAARGKIKTSLLNSADVGKEFKGMCTYRVRKAGDSRKSR